MWRARLTFTSDLSIEVEMRLLICLCLTFALVGDTVLAAPKAGRYPSIKSAAVTVETYPSKPEESRKLIIRDSLGRPAYEFWIVAISMDGRATHSPVELSLTTTGRYSSDPEGRYEPNLLNPDYWGHGVGRWVIRPEEVCPANQDNPVVGARREFNFRRVRVVASVSDVELSHEFCSEKESGNQTGGFSRMRLTVRIEQGVSMRRRPAGYDELGWHYLDLKKCR